MESETNGPFPASVEAAWGLRARPSKGPKRGLRLEGIVDAAVRVADADGIDAVSMSRVARELGVSTMALYRYVDTKDELVVLMVDAALGPPPASAEGRDWRAELTLWAAAMRGVLLSRPWTVPLVATMGPPATPNQLAWLDYALRALRSSGLPEPAKIATALLVSGHVRSEVGVMLAMMADPGNERRWAAYAPFLLRVTRDGRLPALRAAVEAGAFAADAGEVHDSDEVGAGRDEGAGAGEPYDDFAYGLERILDGVEVHIRARAAERHPS